MKPAVIATFLLLTASAVILAGSGWRGSTPGSKLENGRFDMSQAGKPDTWDQADMEKMNATLATLAPKDATSAGKQHLCPVSGKMLGTMGTLQKVFIGDHVVWMCCDDCFEQLLADPQKYLAKVLG